MLLQISMLYAYVSLILLAFLRFTAGSEEGNIEEANTVEHLPSYVNVTADTHTQKSSEILSSNTSIVQSITKTAPKNISCFPSYGDLQVQVVNDTELMKLLISNSNITSKETPAKCLLILFYSKHCPFSCMAAPYFNALPRAFPGIKMVAVDAMYHVFNVQNGVVGVPTLMLFHNSKPVVKYNESEYTLELFKNFVTKHTGIEPEEKSFVTSADFTGPVSSVPLKENDFVLYLAWVFICICAGYYFSKTTYWLCIVESVQNMWRESAQAQHEHID